MRRLIFEMENTQSKRGYEDNFKADWFLDNYIKTLKQQIQHGGQMPFALDFLHHIFATGKCKASKLLDIGTGPTVHTVISASRHVDEIHLSDIGARNREILQNWRDGEAYSEEILEYVCWKENDGTSLADRMDEVRNKVTNIYEIDLRSPNTLKGSDGMYDMVVASLVICSIATNKESYEQILRNATPLIKPGGYIVVIGVLNGTFYIVDNVRFSGSNMAREDLKEIFNSEGLKIVEWRETEPGNFTSYHVKMGLCDAKGLFGVVAQKREEASM